MLGRLARATVGGAALAGGALVASGDEGRRSLLLSLARLDDKLRPTLAAALPPDAFVALYSASRVPYLRALGASAGEPAGDPAAVRAPVRAMGLTFRNDLGNAAGLDKDGSLLEFNYTLGSGFAVVGTVLSEGHTGNVFSFLGGLWSGNAWTPLPLSGGALNSLGLPSKGVDAALDSIRDFRARHGIAPQRATATPPKTARGVAPGGGPVYPIGLSIMGHPAHGADPAKKLDGVVQCVAKALPLCDFIEINESCPNVHHGGGGGGAGDKELQARLRAVVAARDAHAKSHGGRRVPLLVKLGELGDAKETVRFLAALGVDGVVCLNTQKDFASFELPAAVSRARRAMGGPERPPPYLAV